VIAVDQLTFERWEQHRLQEYPPDWEALEAALEPTTHLNPRDPDAPAEAHDPHRVILMMSSIGQALLEAGIPPHFLPIYLDLTAVVTNATIYDEDNPPPLRFTTKDVQHTMAIFADDYFDAVRHICDFLKTGDRTSLDQVPTSWRAAMDPEMLTEHPGMQFLAGMVAHICRDLPGALTDAKVTGRYFQEYDRVVQALILNTIEEHADRLVPGPSWLRNNTITHKIIASYIRQLRIQAWERHEQLKQEPERREELTDQWDATAVKTIKRWRRYGGVAFKGLASMQQMGTAIPRLMPGKHNSFDTE
jgi:hypothetical protein